VSWNVNTAFTLSGDIHQSSTTYIAGLLERGIRVLIYAGVLDLVCGAVANDRTSRLIEWSGQDAFVNTPLRNWEVDGKTAGQIRKSGLLTFASIYGAGHMVRSVQYSSQTKLTVAQVPHDKPVEALALVNRWINEQEL
jgi:carboxypeptidase C (cathepsin A)